MVFSKFTIAYEKSAISLAHTVCPFGDIACNDPGRIRRAMLQVMSLHGLHELRLVQVRY